VDSDTNGREHFNILHKDRIEYLRIDLYWDRESILIGSNSRVWTVDVDIDLINDNLANSFRLVQ